MKRFDWLKENPITRELASQLYRKPRTRRPAAAGLRRVLRRPEPLEPRLLLAAFTVTNANNTGAGSLRAAIADANADAEFDVINFHIPGPGPHVISPQRTNPADPLSVAMPISSPMRIDGYSQAGASPNTLSEGNNADIRIRLDGALAGAGAGGLFIDGGGVTIQGLAITRFEDGVIIRGGSGGNTIAGNFIGLDPFGDARGNLGRGVTIEGSPGNTLGGADPAARNVISANGDIGVRLVHSASVDNVIQGNYIGTNPAGTLDRGNGGPGIEVNEFSTFGFASRTMIGGLEAGAGNVISGNDGSGVVFVGAGAQFNKVLGNRIGTNAAGDAAIANSFSGVVMTFASGNAASDNTIGGDDDDDGLLDGVVHARNIISGNGRAGVAMFGVGADGNQVQGNYIGTDISGTHAIPNGNDGVRLGDQSLGAGPTGNLIGGAMPGAGNLISGNMDNGIEIAGATTSINLIEGNLIGTTATGNALRPNQRAGVLVDGAKDTIIGGVEPGQRNVISGNGAAGVRLNLATATGSAIEGNYIGVGANGITALPNQDGVLITSNASGNTIGGTILQAGNLIAYNVRDGVRIESGTRNTVRLNSIDKNGGLGIDLNGNKQTLNDQDDADSGANELQNWPEILNFQSPQEGIVSVFGFFEGKDDTQYTFDFYVNHTSSSLGHGAEFLATETLTTDANGYMSFAFDFALANPLGKFLTVTATDPDGNTSEFSHDADTDGLYDHWESGAGVDGNGDGTADFFLTNPDPLHKDIYVEVDAMGVIDPAEAGVMVTAAFAAGPVLNLLNPDGFGGITLHFELDPNRIEDEPVTNLQQLRTVKLAEFGTQTEQNNTNLLRAKYMTHRYALFAPWTPRVEGESALLSDELYVSFGAASAIDLAPRFMHELGHSLFLEHGGGDQLNFKPNYHSVMNYAWTTPDIEAGEFQESWELNYSSRAFPTLDENHLVEMEGIRGHEGHWTKVGPYPSSSVPELGPVDWSGDGDEGTGGDVITTGININGLTRFDNSGLTLLKGYDDWSNLILNYRHGYNYRLEFGLELADPQAAVVPNERSYEQYAEWEDLGYSNQAARIYGLPDMEVHAGEVISFDVPATDPEGNALNFSLAPGAPADAMIDPTTGQFTWATIQADGNGEYIITVRVTDAGSGRMRERNYGFKIGVGLTGDYNFNGAVDAADYVIWRKALDQNVAPSTGADGSGNGIVDQADYLVWRANFGKTLLPPASGSGAGAVAALPQRQDLDELADTQTAEPATPVRAPKSDERGANSYSAAIPHFDSPSRNTTSTRGVSSRLMRADTSHAVRRQDDALLAWLATLATNDLSTDANPLREVDIYRPGAHAADMKLTTFDLAFETMGV